MKHFTGSCACGEIEYEVNGELGAIMHCHCSKCRKWHGSAFRTRLSVHRQFFRWTKGEDKLVYWSSSPEVEKTFCQTCGSSLVSFYPKRQHVIGIALGTLNEDPIRRPECHIFVGSKAPWYEIKDNLPQYDELPPSKDRVYSASHP